MSTSLTHRPWALPSRPWVMRMRWCNLLFAHWTVDATSLRSQLPAGLELDLFNNAAYVGAVPFTMEDVSLPCLPGVPGLNTFPELNLRTYVTAGGKPGVWFFSLDAGQKLAVRIARGLFHLPYFDAKFQIDGLRGDIEYRSVRTHRGAPQAIFAANYRPSGPVFSSKPGSLDAWLTDRYCLYSADSSGRIYRGEIHHDRWPLQPASAEVHSNTLGDAFGIEMKGPPTTLHFAKSLDVHAWLLEHA